MVQIQRILPLISESFIVLFNNSGHLQLSATITNLSIYRLSAVNIRRARTLMEKATKLRDLDSTTGDLEFVPEETKENELGGRLDRFRKENPHAQYRIHPQKPGKLQKRVNAGWRAICIHGKQDVQCKLCGSKAFCKHGRMARLCKDCGGKGLCPHGKTKYFCKPCGGKAFCNHNQRKIRCIDCKTKKVQKEVALVLAFSMGSPLQSSKQEAIDIE